jgi:peptide-methionine (S)-S-oxide reductase
MRRSSLLVLTLLLAAACSTSVHAQGAAAPAAGASAKATFAGGCFWCVEEFFDKVPGVISTVSGFTGGKVKNPSYEQVVTGRTGHFEAVQVEYDPARVSYAKLLDAYWRNVDPTQPDGQFCDYGPHYRTAIFVHDEEQRRLAEASRAALRKNKPFKGEIVTEIVKATEFYPAEGYHQDFYRTSPVRYKFYKTGCGREARLQQLWGKAGQ